MNEMLLKVDALLTAQQNHLVEMTAAVEVLRRALRAQEVAVATSARNYYADQMEIVNGITLEINRLVQLAHQAQHALDLQPGATIQ